MSTERESIVGLKGVSADVVYPHVFPNSDREVGGVLVGRSARDGSLPLITGAIPAMSADEQRATLTFTHDTWEHVHKRLDSEFPETDEIVGWYHSHPNFGIFLSGHDLFIHENFFAGPSQIALVVDPHAQTEGVFVWKGGKIEKLYEIATPEGWEVTAPPARTVIASEFLADAPPASAAAAVGNAPVVLPPKPQSTLQQITGDFSPWALAGVALAGVALAFGVFTFVGSGAEPSKTKAPTVHRATRNTDSDPCKSKDETERLIYCDKASGDGSSRAVSQPSSSNAADAGALGKSPGTGNKEKCIPGTRCYRDSASSDKQTTTTTSTSRSVTTTCTATRTGGIC